MARSCVWMGFVLCLMGCPEIPVFRSIDDVTLRYGSSQGLKDRPVSRRDKDRIKACLLDTKEAPTPDEVTPIDRPYLLLVTDQGQVKSLEQQSERYLRGNKGRYFHNTCLHPILSSLE